MQAAPWAGQALPLPYKPEESPMPKKVMVSGCFDLLHSGHVAFFKEASSYGDLYVALGSDKTLFDLKGRVPINTEQERLFMVKAVSYVKDAFISHGSGLLDFIEEFKAPPAGHFYRERGWSHPGQTKTVRRVWG